MPLSTFAYLQVIDYLVWGAVVVARQTSAILAGKHELASVLIVFSKIEQAGEGQVRTLHT